MLSFLPGAKTYIVAVCMVIVGVVNMLTGDATGWAMIAEHSELLLEGLGIGALRKGIS